MTVPQKVARFCIKLCCPLLSLLLASWCASLVAAEADKWQEALDAAHAVQSITEHGCTYAEYRPRVQEARIKFDRVPKPNKGTEREIKRLQLGLAIDSYENVEESWRNSFTDGPTDADVKRYRKYWADSTELIRDAEAKAMTKGKAEGKGKGKGE